MNHFSKNRRGSIDFQELIQSICCGTNSIKLSAESDQRRFQILFHRIGEIPGSFGKGLSYGCILLHRDPDEGFHGKSKAQACINGAIRRMSMKNKISYNYFAEQYPFVGICPHLSACRKNWGQLVFIFRLTFP